MSILDKFLKRRKNHDLIEEKTTDAKKQNFAQGYTGIISSQNGYLGRKNGHAIVLIDGIRISSSAPFQSKPKERLNEEIRGMVLLFDAQDALKAEDIQAFKQIKRRAIHEKILAESENEEFRALIAEACTKAANETEKDYRDPEYRKVFASVMVRAESIQFDANEKIAEIKDKRTPVKPDIKQETLQKHPLMLNQRYSHRIK
ncbi:MAG: hypothetical protein IJ870_03410 [Alphaproteobacteria bacterium]|nr:hypothetical protein [Alphaproteobacteria bacterium]